jgi:hypothetical protein
MNKNRLVNGFIIATFVSLYVLVSVVSTIHVIDFFELSNPRWLAITLAVGFEIGAAASLASLITLDKMNKTIVWFLFIAITLMQMQGNMYHAFQNLEEYGEWVELFNLLEWDPLAQKRLLACVSGAILPLVALGFIKSLVDYIKPEEDTIGLTETGLEDSENNTDELKKKVISKEENISHSGDVDTIEIPFTELGDTTPFTKKDIETILKENDNAKEPNIALKNAAIDYNTSKEVKPGSIPFEKKDRIDGLTKQSVENRKVKNNQVKEGNNGGRGPLYDYRMDKHREADPD